MSQCTIGVIFQQQVQPANEKRGQSGKCTPSNVCFAKRWRRERWDVHVNSTPREYITNL